MDFSFSSDSYRAFLTEAAAVSTDPTVRVDAAARLDDLVNGGPDCSDHSVAARRRFLEKVLVSCEKPELREAAACGIVSLGDDAGASDELKAQRIRELLA
jgi:hypothetical protein